MGCPVEMIDESKGNILEEMRDYFARHQGGRDSPMADSRFSAALDKIKSVQNPTKADFAEVVALMKFGSCPGTNKSRVSTESLGWMLGLEDEVDESQEVQLEEDLQTCFAEEECDAINAKFPQAQSLMQQGESSSTL